MNIEKFKQNIAWVSMLVGIVVIIFLGAKNYQQKRIIINQHEVITLQQQAIDNYSKKTSYQAEQILELTRRVSDIQLTCRMYENEINVLLNKKEGK